MIKSYEDVNCLENLSMIAGSKKTFAIACVYPNGSPIPLARYSEVGCRFAPYGQENSGMSFDGSVTIGDDDNGNVGNALYITVPTEQSAAYQNCMMVYMPYIVDNGEMLAIGKGKLFIASAITK